MRKEGNAMLNVRDRFPRFRLKGVVSNDIKNAFVEVTAEDYPGKWLVIFSWPKDFTFICPTEIVEFGRLEREFASRNAQVLGFSTDTEFVHLAWRQQNEELSTLPFPMLSDQKRELSQALGILDPVEGVAQRATFIVDPDRIIRFAMVTDLSVGRNPKEVLRVLDALQTGELCPSSWQKGQPTLKVR
jgi:peroxiredoxin (alkyl hydroperoxide reductase subunit C)